jgi:fatty acid desaturase
MSAMTHKSFLQSLPDAVRIELVALDDAASVRRLALHLGALAGSSVWIATGWPLWWVLLPVQALLIAALFMLAHEATHRTLLSPAHANDALGHFAGATLLLPFLWFRYFHLAHHRHTNDPAHDPELLGAPKPETRAAWAWHVSGLPYWIAACRVLWRLVRGRADDEFVPRGAVAGVVAEARIMAALYALGALSLLMTPIIFWVWLLPAVFGQMALRIFLFAEHADCPHVADMLENTRTTLTTRLLRALTLNASYHIEHHTLPQTPWHKLPRLHALMRAELKTVAEGYVGFTREYLGRR